MVEKAADCAVTRTYTTTSTHLFLVVFGKSSAPVNATRPSPLFPKTSYDPVCNKDLTDFDTVDAVGVDVGVVNARHWLLSVGVEDGV